MPVIDTSVLVPLFDADHPRHAEARQLVAAPVLLHVTGGVLAELTTVLRRRGKDAGLDGARVAREALVQLEALHGFRHVIDYDAEAVSRAYAQHSALSYVDAWGVVLALEMGEDLMTFDDRQLAAYVEEKS
jgi:predicted nucleic acid-binding protein